MMIGNIFEKCINKNQHQLLGVFLNCKIKVKKKGLF